MVEAANNENGVLDSDRLPDPLNDRKVTTVKPPPIVPLSKERVFPGGPASPN